MAVVDVGMSVYDLYLLSDRVGLTDRTTPHGQPIFSSGRRSPTTGQSGLWDLDFAAVRVNEDTWHVVKARKMIFADGQVHGFLRTHHAYIRQPVDEVF